MTPALCTPAETKALFRKRSKEQIFAARFNIPKVTKRTRPGSVVRACWDADDKTVAQVGGYDRTVASVCRWGIVTKDGLALRSWVLISQ